MYAFTDFRFGIFVNLKYFNTTVININMNDGIKMGFQTRIIGKYLGIEPLLLSYIFYPFFKIIPEILDIL